MYAHARQGSLKQGGDKTAPKLAKACSPQKLYIDLYDCPDARSLAFPEMRSLAFQRIPFFSTEPGTELLPYRDQGF